MRAVHDPRYRAFLRRLRKAREDAGLTQAAVASKLRRPQSFISKSETGERRIDVIELAELASVYRKQLSYFVPESESAGNRK